MNEDFGRAERDMLIEVRTEVRAIASDVRELKDDTKERLIKLEEAKLSKEDAARMKTEADALHADHEARMRRLERYGSAAIGALAIIQFALNYFK